MESIPYVDLLLEILTNKGCRVLISNQFYEQNRLKCSLSLDSVFHTATEDDIDILLSLGGDGTMLDSTALVGQSNIPILGINMGKLGFLATIAKDHIAQALDKLFSKEFEIERRTLIQLRTEVDYFDGSGFALNEFSILRRETQSMITVKAFLNGEHLNTYWADGIMVATPTGSTGYSLSCGGPIVLPQANNFIITPVSPHNLNVRPLIVPDISELTFEVYARDRNFLISLDTRSRSIEGDVTFHISKAQFEAQLIRISGYNFVQTLKNKLSWGLDKRN
jgi:NAD+ kinase